MLWLCLPLFFVALTYRAYINKGQVTATPDEKVYSTYAITWRAGRAYREAVEAFLSRPGLEIPPTRYGFFALSALVNRKRSSWTQSFRPVIWISAVAGALTVPAAYLVTHDLRSSLLVASSPLSLMLSRKALQDTLTAFFMVLALWGVQTGNTWILGTATACALASREALIFYLPAIFVAWGLRTGRWVEGSIALGGATVLAVMGFYALGGRKLLTIFRKLRRPTDYIRRFQSGPLHRLLVDLVLISPLVTVATLMGWSRVPVWLAAFAGTALVLHSFITPKNVRFLLVVDLAIRMMCASLPNPILWAVLVLGSVADLWLYRALGKIEDPVTANLVVRSGMYLEK